MILPVVAYGDPVLRAVAKDINKDHPALMELVGNMFETMYSASGVGLAAPQVGQSIRLFVIDASPFSDEDPSLDGFKRVFINARILEESGEDWVFNEGCLSFPGLREDIVRKSIIRLRWLDEDFKEQEETFDGLRARVIQHEYDHIEGILFTDKISMLKKTLIKKKLQNIMDGKARPDYRMKFANKKGR